MELTDLEEAIAEAADDLASLAPSVGGKGKAYEVWILFELAVRLMRAGYPVAVRDPADIDLGVFRVRGAPGGMPDADAPGDDNPSHFHVAGEAHDLEIHVGLQVQGVSTSRHEIDITVLPAEIGRKLRDEGGGPYAGPLMLGLELKAYDGKHKLSQGFPRALVGVAVDVDPAWLHPRIGLFTHGGGLKVLHAADRTLFGLATSTDLYANSRTYLEHHGIVFEEGLAPNAVGGLFDQLVERLIAVLGPPPTPAPVAPRSRAYGVSV